MATITTRAGKGSPLTNAEVDANFNGLNSELGGKADLSADNVLAGKLTSQKTIGFNAETDNGNGGTAKSVAWATRQKQKLTLTGNCTLTFDWTGCPVGHYQLKLIQDGTGSRSVTWSTGTPGATKWLGSASAPGINSTAASETFVNLYWDGATCYGSVSKVGAA